MDFFLFVIAWMALSVPLLVYLEDEGLLEVVCLNTILFLDCCIAYATRARRVALNVHIAAMEAR